LKSAYLQTLLSNKVILGIELRQNSPLSSDFLTLLYVAGDNKKWIGTANGQLLDFDGPKWHTVKPF